MTLTLRPYQRECIDDIRARWRAGAVRVPVVLATGLGKTVIFCTLITEWLADPENAGKRVVVIVHTTELAQQAIGKMRAVAPHLRVGLVKAAANNTTAQVIVASRQTLASEKRRSQLRNVGLIVIDECHHAHSANTYGTILRHFDAFGQCEHCQGEGCDECNNVGQWDPGVRVAGFTATLARADKVKLSTVWQDCTFTRDILFGIRNGYLLDVRGERIVVDDFDVTRVKKVAGDYSEASLAEELERTFAIETIAAKVAEIASDRKGIAFWPLVATAEHACKVFESFGLRSAVVSGQIDKRERDRIVKAFAAGEYAWVHNAMVFTEGFDDPNVDAVLVGRRTSSPVLYTQMAGRGLRTPPGIPRELWRPMMLIDPVGASEETSLRLLLDLSKERAAHVAELRDDVLLSEFEEELATLVEADLEEKRKGASFEFESDEYRGPVTTRTFDPLGRGSAWGKTRGGIPFIKAGGDAYAFVVEIRPGEHDVVLCSVSAAQPGAWGKRVESGMAFDAALTCGEAAAFEHGGHGAKALVSRKHAWRKKEPGHGLVAKAAAAGVPHELTRNGTAGEVSDALDAILASHRIDTIVARIPRIVQ